MFKEPIVNFEALRKVCLHDHLDGGLRPQTLLELGAQCDAVLPADTAAGLVAEIRKRTTRGSLTAYLETFCWTVGVMQTEDALSRVAEEAVVDLAADGVALAELRFAPLLHTAGGLQPQAVVEAVCDGLARGQAKTGIDVGLLLCGIRNKDEFAQVAELFRRNYRRNRYVVGVDLAGPELGFRPSAHPALKDLAAEFERAPITVHAGEADGLASIRDALACGARRIGHGIALAQDLHGEGTLVDEVLRRQITLEISVSSNVDTRAVASLEAHPLPELVAAGVPVVLCTDNRLMSDTSHSREHALVAQAFGFTARDFERFTETGRRASFLND